MHNWQKIRYFYDFFPFISNYYVIFVKSYGRESPFFKCLLINPWMCSFEFEEATLLMKDLQS